MNLDTWQNIKIPDNVLQNIKNKQYYPQFKKRKRIKLSDLLTFFYVLFWLFGAIMVIAGLSMFISNFFFDYRNTSELYSSYPQYFVFSSMLILFLVLPISIFIFKQNKNVEQNRVKDEIERYQKEEFAKQQSEIDFNNRLLQAKKDKERQQKNLKISESFRNDLKLVSDYIFLFPYLSYSDWLNKDEWHARGNLKRLYERMGYKVEFYKYRTLAILHPSATELKDIIKLIKFNDSTSKPNTNAITKFIREIETLRPDSSIFISIEDCSENAKKLAKSKNIKLNTLREFILLLPDKFGFNPYWGDGISEYLNYMLIYFSTGKKKKLVNGYELSIDFLKNKLNDLSKDLEYKYVKKLDEMIISLDIEFKKNEQYIIDDEILGDIDYLEL